MIDETPKFREVQYFPWWANVGMAGSVPFVLALWITQAGSKPVPGKVALPVVVLLSGVFLLLFRMVTLIYSDQVVVEFGWLRLIRFKMPVSGVKSCRPVTYSPIGDFGGWGIRFGREGKLAYIARGNRAAEVVTEKRALLIGTERPEELSQVINSLLGAGE
ncbi:MAG: hypothetical protein HY318_14665 [Armatimonadetes bacterium]|nr:hypothetical protein [Armatimonadota bacterium]